MMTKIAPIFLHGRLFPTVQEAFLCALRAHESLKTSPAYANYPADLLRHLVNDLNDIRDGIAARAVPDEQVAA